MNIGIRSMNARLLTMIAMLTLALAGCGSKDQVAQDARTSGEEHGHEEGKEGAHIELTAEQVKAAGVELI